MDKSSVIVAVVIDVEVDDEAVTIASAAVSRSGHVLLNLARCGKIVCNGNEKTFKIGTRT
jgi:hypothetical protein